MKQAEMRQISTLAQKIIKASVITFQAFLWFYLDRTNWKRSCHDQFDRSCAAHVAQPIYAPALFFETGLW